MRIGGRFKLLENFSENLMYVPELAAHQSLLTATFNQVSQCIELEFNQSDPSIFYFSTPGGLFRFNRKDTILEPTQLDTVGLGSPSSLSMSDKGYLLVGFTCGSIG